MQKPKFEIKRTYNIPEEAYHRSNRYYIHSVSLEPYTDAESGKLERCGVILNGRAQNEAHRDLDIACIFDIPDLIDLAREIIHVLDIPLEDQIRSLLRKLGE